MTSFDLLNRVYFKNVYTGFGAVPITSDYLDAGFTFSLPTYNAGIKLLIQTEIKVTYWSFLETFDVYLWVMIIVTTAVTGVIAWLFEDQTFACKFNARCQKNFKEMMWQAFSSLFFTSEIRLQKFSARIVFLCFWFMVLILTATYTANLTSQLSNNPQNSKNLLFCFNKMFYIFKGQ